MNTTSLDENIPSQKNNMSTLYQYIVPCLTEGINVSTDYRTTVPTACPNNNTHTINPSGIFVISTLSTTPVTLDQGSIVSTNNHYLSDHFELAVGGGIGATAAFDIEYDYNVSVHTLTLFGSSENIGDSFDLVAFPDTVFGGTIAAAASNSDTVLTLDYVVGLDPGYTIAITDGVNTDDLGYIVSVDTTLNTITVKTPVVNSFAVGSNVIYSIPKIRNCKVVNDHNITFGEKIVRSSGLPTGEKATLTYTNSTVDPKTVNFGIELQY